jgi:hypothetical protein
MEKYSKAVSEMYSQFKKKEAHPMEKYIGKHVVYLGCEEEVVGYTTWPDGSYGLVIASSQKEGWTMLGPYDVIFKKCERYWYASISDLID